MAEETKIIRIVIDSSKAVDGSAAATRALERLEKAQGTAASSMDRMEKALGSIGGYMKANLALLAADMAARFIQMGKNALNAVAGLDELAEQLGITTTGLQALQFSAVQNGVKLEQLETGISKFSQKMGDAANGSKDMVEALNAIGVKNLDLQGKLRPTEALLEDVAAAIIKIDDPAKRAAAAVDFFGKAGSRMLPMLPDIAAGAGIMAQKAADAGAMIDGTIIKKLDKLADHSEVSALKFRALVATIGAPIATDAMDAVNNILGRLLANIKELDSQRRQSEQGVLPEADLKMLQNRADFWNKKAAVERNNARTQTMAERANEALRNATANAGGVIDPIDRAAIIQDQYATQLLVSGSFPPTEPLPAPGAGTSTVKGAGEDVADRMRKALQDSGREMEQARAFAAAANQGADAVAKLEIHFKALKTAQDIFGKAANDNKEGVERLTAKLEEQAVATQKLKAVGDFRLATEALRDQNELLAAEIRLTNELPEIRARELALIKLTQEEKAKGQKFSDEDREARLAALDTGERLKVQAEEIKRSTELWMEPLKTALSSIQTTAADAFEGMLNSGKYNFEELGQVFKKMVIRMAAEFMALATVRPVMSVLVNAVSPGMASTFGLGGGTSMPSLGGGSGMSMPSMGGGDGGGLSGMFGGVGSFLSQPLGSLFPSAAPAGGFADVGALLQSGQTGASAAQSGISGIGGVSIGSALGAGLGIGMGAYQALTSKSTGGTLGGIGTMIGSGMMLIPGMQIPGMIVTALSAILPSIIGEPNTRTHSSTNANLRYGSGSWYTTGGAYGSGANSSQSESQLRGLTGGIDSVFDLMGGVKDASKVWGLDASSWTAQGKDWSYTSRATHLVDPNGNREAWRMNMGDMMDTGAAQVAIRSILGGAVGEITATMTTALKAMSAASMGIEETGKSIVFVDEVYERLGKGALTVRSQFRELESQFTEMTATAKRLGLSLAPIEAEQKKAAERFARDFIDGMLDPLAVQMRALDDQRKDSIASAEYIRDNVKDVYVDMAKIAEYWTKKELELKNQAYSASVDSLQNLIKRLTYGDLANASPDTSLAGTRGTYEAALAQSRAGNDGAFNNLAGYAEAYTGTARNYFASSAEYDALITQIRRDLEEQVAARTGGSTATGTAAANDASNAVLNSNAELRATVATLSQQLAKATEAMAAAAAQMQRRA